MRTTSGRVVAGKILVEGEPLPDGSDVTDLTGDADETFELDVVVEGELLESIAEADRADLLPAEKALRSLWLVARDSNCKGE